jgi:hypothetical protein
MVAEGAHMIVRDELDPPDNLTPWVMQIFGYKFKDMIHLQILKNVGNRSVWVYFTIGRTRSGQYSAKLGTNGTRSIFFEAL